MSFIILEGEKISFEDIPGTASENNFNGYSKNVLSFCTSWLRNETVFEVATSGSTGDPKKILWTRELMLWSIKNTALALHLKKGMHCLHCIDAGKTGGKMMLARAVHLGMSVEIIEPKSNPLKNSSSTHFDFASMVPLQIHQLLNENKLEELNKIDTLIIGGAVLNSKLIEAIQSSQTKVYTTYGMTETASHIALQRVNGKEKQNYFFPLHDVKVGMDENSCALISTPFHHNLITNDIIALHEKNSFEVVGRKDNIINSGGHKISIEKIEDALDKTLTSLKMNFFNFCAYSQPDERLGNSLIVILETAPLVNSILHEITLELGNSLEKHELPKAFYFTDKLVYTSSGKIDRRKTAEKVI